MSEAWKRVIVGKRLGSIRQEVSVEKLDVDVPVFDCSPPFGEQLFLSVRTVESHRAHIQQKLGRNTRAELVAYALEHGMIAGAEAEGH